MSAPEESGQAIPARWLHVGAAVAVAVAATGYFAGLRPPEPIERNPVVESPGEEVALAPSYGEMRDMRRGDNARMYEGAVSALGAEVFPVGPLPVGTPQERAQAAALRKAHRAYDGAPPTIPHEVDQRGVPGCLSCHERGMKLGGRVAPRISHPPYQSCVQCHVVSDSPRPLVRYPDMPRNGFVGLASAGNGSRAWGGAPPTLPHPTHMRDECSSCHGPTGLPGLRTSHPERRSCVQCHASSAEMDQRVGQVSREARP
jgi:nitrate reductase (cytochrome), electron transfer subunit